MAYAKSEMEVVCEKELFSIAGKSANIALNAFKSFRRRFAVAGTRGTYLLPGTAVASIQIAGATAELRPELNTISLQS